MIRFDEMPPRVEVLEQGIVVAEKLKDYLHRHTDMEQRLTRGASRTFLTTDLTDRFDRLAQIFFGEPIHSRLICFDEEADCDCR